ncbi:MAG: DoxX family protein [Planctomycetes bacterium]|nr:DoxX family protein [Planctomycetota bacterium]
MKAIAILVSRMPLGLLFLLAGYMKLFTMGMEKWMSAAYPGAVPSWLPNWFATPFGYAVPVVELIAGAMLIIGLFGRTAATLIFLMLVSFSIALIAKTGSITGGDQGFFHPNITLAGFALLLIVTGPGAISVDRLWGKKFTATVEVK